MFFLFLLCFLFHDKPSSLNSTPQAVQVRKGISEAMAGWSKFHSEGSLFVLGHSVDARAAFGMLAGGNVWFSVMGGCFPKPCMEILEAAKEFKESASGDDAAKAKAKAKCLALNTHLQPVWDCMLQFGSLRVAYAMVNLCNMCPTEVSMPRPLLNLKGDQLQQVQDALVSAGLLGEASK